MTPLWTSADIAAATGGTASSDFAVAGVAYDSREVGEGDLFVALAGDTTDGHRFVPQAMRQGAAGILASEAVDAPHILAADTAAALDALGKAARARTAARIVGVTGSVGKTGVKEALFQALDRAAPGRAHRSLRSYNNHVGVPLSLARMPAGMRFGVFEMGMNHAGELSALTRVVRPDVAVVTAIAPAHAEYFASEAAIADAKAEIFEGLEPGGTAILPFDSPHRDRLAVAARRHAATVWTFGTGDGADVQAVEAVPAAGGRTLVSARLPDAELTFTLALAGDHWLRNAMAVLAAAHAAGGDLAAAGLALAEMEGLPGRGRRLTVRAGDGEATILDESYNANPASMAATLATLAREPGRKVAVLGEMRELGRRSGDYHAALAGPIDEADVDLAILVGDGMGPLAEALEGATEFVHVADAAAAADALARRIEAGDAILVKGSNAVGLGRLVERLAAGHMPCST